MGELELGWLRKAPVSAFWEGARRTNERMIHRTAGSCGIFLGRREREREKRDGQRGTDRAEEGKEDDFVIGKSWLF